MDEFISLGSFRLFLFSVLLPLRSYFVEGWALSKKGTKEKIRKDHIKALDKGDLVLIIFGFGRT
jgi:hypothetical protein